MPYGPFLKPIYMRPYGPFSNPYICGHIWPVPKQKQNLYFTKKTKTNILYKKKKKNLLSKNANDICIKLCFI